MIGVTLTRAEKNAGPHHRGSMALVMRRTAPGYPTRTANLERGPTDPRNDEKQLARKEYLSLQKAFRKRRIRDVFGSLVFVMEIR